MGYGLPTKRDGNHAEIASALKRSGASVVDLSSVGSGCPDLLVGRNGGTYLLEIKCRDGKQGHRAKADRADFDPEGELTDRQVEWLSSWRGQPVRIVHDAREALLAVCATEAEVSSSLADTGPRSAVAKGESP